MDATVAPDGLLALEEEAAAPEAAVAPEVAATSETAPVAVPETDFGDMPAIVPEQDVAMPATEAAVEPLVEAAPEEQARSATGLKNNPDALLNTPEAAPETPAAPRLGGITMEQLRTVQAADGVRLVHKETGEELLPGRTFATTREARDAFRQARSEEGEQGLSKDLRYSIAPDRSAARDADGRLNLGEISQEQATAMRRQPEATAQETKPATSEPAIIVDQQSGQAVAGDTTADRTGDKTADIKAELASEFGDSRAANLLGSVVSLVRTQEEAGAILSAVQSRESVQGADQSRKARLTELIERFKLDVAEKEGLTEEQQGVKGVFSGELAKAKIRLSDLDAVKGYVNIERGRADSNSGAAHILLDHYSGDRGAVTAGEILQIGELIRRGKMREVGEGKRVYTVKSDGLRFRAVVGADNRGGVVITFYSNRKDGTKLGDSHSAVLGKKLPLQTFDSASSEKSIPTAAPGVKVGEGATQGFIANGRVHFVADGIAKGQAVGVLLHELGEHAAQLGFANDSEYRAILGKTGNVPIFTHFYTIYAIS